MDQPLKNVFATAINAIEAAAAIAASNAERATSDAERHAAFAKDAVEKIKAASKATEELPSAVLETSSSCDDTCDICDYLPPWREVDKERGICSICAEHLHDGPKYYTEEFAHASAQGKDALRLLIVRQRADNCRDTIAAAASYDGDLELHEASVEETFLNKRAAECLVRLPASFAPWWKDTWSHEKWCEMASAREAAGWPVKKSALIAERLAAMFLTQQHKASELKKAQAEQLQLLEKRLNDEMEVVIKHKLKEMEAKHAEVLANIERARKEDLAAVKARHQLELEAAWEAGATEGVHDMEDVMKEKLEEMEAEHKKQMAAVTEASAEASNAVGEAAEKIRHDARRRGYADGYAFSDQKATKVIQGMRADLEAARKEGENHQAGYIRLIGERDEAILEVVDLRQELDASAEAKEKLEAQVEALEAAAAANYQAGYSAAEEKFRAEFQELRKCRAVGALWLNDATDVFQAMRADLERLSAENKALREKAEEDKQMVQRHLKEVAKGHAEMTVWEKEEIERLRKDVRAHEARVGWHADMAKRDTEENVAKVKALEAQVADHSRWRDEANHAASLAELEAKKLRANLAEADWEKEQLVKAVEALRELVGPTQKLMKSNPELFGGEALPAVKTEPMPPAIIRMREPVSEEEMAKLVVALKKLVPRYCGVVESTPTVLPGIVEAEVSTEGLCMALTEAQYQEMVKAEPPIVPDQPAVCGCAGCIECPRAEPVAEAQPEPVAEAQPEPVAEAQPEPVAEAQPEPVAKPKPNYNHPNWPSPITKRFAKHLAKHSGLRSPWHSHDPKTIKTHEDALEYIAKRVNISVETLLGCSMKQYQTTYDPWTLVKGPNNFEMGTAPATWWC